MWLEPEVTHHRRSSCGRSSPVPQPTRVHGVCASAPSRLENPRLSIPFSLSLSLSLSVFPSSLSFHPFRANLRSDPSSTRRVARFHSQRLTSRGAMITATDQREEEIGRNVIVYVRIAERSRRASLSLSLSLSLALLACLEKRVDDRSVEPRGRRKKRGGGWV